MVWIDRNGANGSSQQCWQRHLFEQHLLETEQHDGTDSLPDPDGEQHALLSLYEDAGGWLSRSNL